MTPREWDAESYDVVATPMTARGVELVDRLDLAGTERALDAGCGTGHVTQRLAQRLPGGHVVALDGSEKMLEVARARLGDERVSYVHADLEQPLPVDSVDVIVSTSTFHWVSDHDALFANLAAVLNPGGTLDAEFGGEGNIASVMAILRDLGLEDDTWRFKGVEDTLARLDAAGFTDCTAELVPRPAHLPPGQLHEYLRTVVLGAHVAKHGVGVVAQVAERMDEPVIDYVRLVIHGTRDGSLSS